MTGAPRLVVAAGLAVMLAFAPVSISGTQAGLAIALAGAAWEILRGRALPRTVLDAPIIALLGVTLVSAFASEAPAESLRRFAGAWVTLTFYLCVGWLGDAVRLERALRVLLAPAAVFGLYGIVQHFTGVNLFGSGGAGMHSLEISGRTVYFPRGAFSHYQTFANVYFILFCLSFALAAGGGGRGRAARWGLTALLGTVVVFTFTRGIWLALLAALGIFAWVFARRLAFAIGAAGAAALLLVLVVPSSLSTRALSMADIGANAERLLLWETTWNMVRDRPLLGFGIGSYRRAQDAYVREEVPQTMTRTHAHNIWLQAAVERGILGMLALLWLAVALVAEAVRAARLLRPAGGLPHALAVAALAALAGFFIDGLVQNNFGDSQVALLFWLVAGVVVVCGRLASCAVTPGAGAPA